MGQQRGQRVLRLKKSWVRFPLLSRRSSSQRKSNDRIGREAASHFPHATMTIWQIMPEREGTIWIVENG
jgi:hypothetical protein